MDRWKQEHRVVQMRGAISVDEQKKTIRWEPYAEIPKSIDTDEVPLSTHLRYLRLDSMTSFVDIYLPISPFTPFDRRNLESKKRFLDSKRSAERLLSQTRYSWI